MRFVVLALILVLISCGKDDGGSDDTAGLNHNAFLVQDAASLPACDAESEGWIIYVKADTKLVTCAAGAWADAPLGSGSGSFIEKRYGCEQAKDDVDTSADITLKSNSVVFVKFKSGDAFLSCSSLMTTSTGLIIPAANSIFFGPNDPATINGKFICPTQILITEFSLADGNATYTAKLDDTQTKTEACKELL